MKVRLLVFLCLSAATLSFLSCKKDKKIKPGKPTGKVYKLLTVPTQYATIQAAINAAGENDTIKVLAGRYQERVVINKSVNIVGAGSDKTQIAISGDLATPAFEEVILVQSGTKINVSISGLEVLGGNWNEIGFYDGETRFGLYAINTKLKLKDLMINHIRNAFVLFKDGELDIDGIQLFTLNTSGQCDLGVEIINSKARINNLYNKQPQIDHVIDVNLEYLKSTENDFSDVTITNSRINTSLLFWGDGIRAAKNAKLKIDNCNIYRSPMGEPIPSTSSFNGIQLDNVNNTVTIRNTVIDGLPIGIGITPGQSPAITIEGNNIKNCDTGIWINTWDRAVVDLGGGSFNSKGNNIFSGNREYDIKLFSSANVSALHNQWSDASNPASKIWDKTDDPTLGKVNY